MKYMTAKTLLPSLRDLNAKSGPFSKAADQVYAVVTKISAQEPDPFGSLSPTNHGEKRIEKCIKYDLIKRCRLVTVVDKDVTCLLFAGDHNAVDEWIESNRGFSLVAEKGEVVPVFVSRNPDDTKTRITGDPSLQYGTLVSMMSDRLFDQLLSGLNRSLLKEIDALESTNTEEDIFDLADKVEDEIQKTAIFDVFCLLRQGKKIDARKRLEIYLGELCLLEEISEDQTPDLLDSDHLKSIPTDSPQFLRMFEHYMKTADYKDWMMYLHPDQESVAYKDFSGSAKLTGVSGSGKTCIVVKRAIHLAETNPDSKTLVVTLNKPLARLIQDLVENSAVQEVSARIEVRAFFELCQKLLLEFEPDNGRLYDDVTWKSREHIDEVWREFYRCKLNNHDAAVLQPVHDSLVAREIRAELYIREEFDWIRSAVPQNERNDYLQLMRKGRSYPFDESFRRKMIRGLDGWESKMWHVGVTDYLGISTALGKYLSRISPRYGAVLIDESQDFGTLELKILRRLVDPGPNDIFVSGDAAQHVSSKHQSLKQAGILVASSNSMEIKRNYRNTRAILKAAHEMLVHNLTDEMLENEDFVILDPEYADIQGSDPLNLFGTDPETEIASALQYCEEAVESRRVSKCCISLCGWSLYEIQEFGSKIGYSVLDGTTSIDKGSIFLSDLEQTKGFEFDLVVIVNVNQGVIPNPSLPEKERFRDLSRFYVAMTRAKTELVLSSGNNRSSLLDAMHDRIQRNEWENYLENADLRQIGLPPSLDSILEKNFSSKAIGLMNGEEFLYTEFSLGLSLPLIEKLRELIAGKKVIRNGRPVGWKDLGSAAKDVRQDPVARQQFGPVVVKEFQTLSKQLGI